MKKILRPQDIIEKIQLANGQRKKVNLFLNEEKYNRFKEYCDKVGVKSNEVMENLMDYFTGSLD